VLHWILDEPVLVVLLTVGLGAGLGSIQVRGFSFGPAAALFVGLAAGAVDASVSSTTGLGQLRELGLILFTYTVGLAAGPTFSSSLRRGGLRASAVTVVLVGVAAALCAGAKALLALPAAERAGLFAGATTNTPALQAAASNATDGDPVVAYSLTYPLAVASMLVAVTLILGRRLPLPARLEPPAPQPVEDLVNWTVEVTRAGLPVLGALRAAHPDLTFSRLERGGVVTVATAGLTLAVGDNLVVVGPRAAVAAFCAEIGRRSDRSLPEERSGVDFRRVVLSNRELAGRRLVDLDLTGGYGVVATRVRRGDVDLAAHDDMVLLLGDRVRVVGPRESVARAARLLGDSERSLAELDAFGFAIGLGAGLLLGLVSVPLPGSGQFSLGAGGGTLVAGLALGTVARTGPVTWQLPHAANQVLRQLGILIFLGCAGLGSASTFADAVATRHGLTLMAAGGVVAALFSALVVVGLQLTLRRDTVEAAGLFSGLQTQPAALGYAAGRIVGDDRVHVAYTTVFPAAMIAKILVVQLLI